MVFELIEQLVTSDSSMRGKIYRKLERAGINRKTADEMAKEFYKEWK